MNFSQSLLDMTPDDLRNLGCNSMMKMYLEKNPYVTNQIDHVFAAEAAAKNEGISKLDLNN